MGKTEFLFLSEPDLIKAGVLDSARCVDVCEEVFRLLSSGDYLMGGPDHNEHGLVIVFPKEPKFARMPKAGPERRFIAMPTYLGGRFSICGEKWYGSNIENPLKRGLPRSVLTVTLNDPESCEPLAYMSGNLISSMRTGCIPAVALRHIAGAAETVSVVGVGPVQRATLKAFCSQRKEIKRVVALARRLESARGFAVWAEAELGLVAETVETLEGACRAGDIVSIAASPKTPLFLEDQWFKAGSTVALTSPVNADDDFWLKNFVCFDNAKMHQAYYAQAQGLGDILKAANGWGRMYSLMEGGRMSPLEDALSLGDIVVDPALADIPKDTKRVFVTSGQVVFDIAWGFDLYHAALSKDLGQKLALWDEPYWK